MSDGLEHLDDPGAQELLCSGQPLRLAYAGRDGLPRVIPIGFLWKEEQIVVCTAPSAPKVAALTERPNVAITIDTGNTSDTAKQLLIRGTAAIDIVDGVAPEYIEASGKTLSGTDLEEFDAQVQGVFEQQRESRSLPNGRGSMTSAPAGYLRSCAGWPKPTESGRKPSIGPNLAR